MATSINLDIHIKNQQDLDAFNKRLDKAATELEQLAVSQGKSVSAFKLLSAEIKKNGAAVGTIGSSYKQLIADHQKLEARVKSLNTQYVRQGAVQQALHSSTRGFAGAMGKLWLSYNQLIPVISSFTATMVTLKSLKAGTEFDYTTRYINTLVGTGEDAEASLLGIRDTLLGMKDLTQTPTELALGMKEFAKAGIDTAAAMAPLSNSIDGALGEMSRFASVAEMDMAKSLELVIGYANSFSDVDFVGAANAVAKSALSSSTSVAQMGEALKHTTELGATANFRFVEVAAALGMLANKGIRGSQAGTALRTTFLKLLKPTDKAREIMEKFNVNFTAVADGGKIKSLRDQIVELGDATAHLTQADLTIFFKELSGLRAMKALSALSAVVRGNVADFDAFIKKVDEADERTTFLQKTFEELSASASYQFKMLRADFERALIEAYDQENVTDSLREMREIITSPEFKQGLNFLVNSFLTLANITLKGINAVVGEISRQNSGRFNDNTAARSFFPDPWDMVDDGYKNATERQLAAARDRYASHVKELNEIQENSSTYMLDGVEVMASAVERRMTSLKQAITDTKQEISALTAQNTLPDSSFIGLWEEKARKEAEATKQATKEAAAAIQSQADEAKKAAQTALDQFDMMIEGIQRKSADSHRTETQKLVADIQEQAAKVREWFEKGSAGMAEELKGAYLAQITGSKEVTDAAQLEAWAVSKLTDAYRDDLAKARKKDAELTAGQVAQSKAIFEDLKAKEKALREYITRSNAEIAKEKKQVEFVDAAKAKAQVASLKGLAKVEAEILEKRRSAISTGKINQSQAEEYTKALLEEAAATGKLRDAFIESAEASNSFVAGFAAGFLEVQEDFMTLGKVGKEVFSSLHDGWLATGDAIVEAAWTGDLGGLFDALRDTWSDTLQDMLKAFMQWLMELALQWAASGIVELVGSSLGLNLGGLLGGGSGGGINLGTIFSAASTAKSGSNLLGGSSGGGLGWFSGPTSGGALNSAGNLTTYGSSAYSAWSTGVGTASSWYAGTQAAEMGVNAGTQLALIEGTYGAAQSGAAAGAAQAVTETTTSTAAGGTAGISGGVAGLGVFGAFMAAVMALDTIGHNSGYDRETIPTGVGNRVLDNVVDPNQDSIISVDEMFRDVRSNIEHIQEYAEAISFTGDRASEAGSMLMDTGQAAKLLEHSLDRAGLEVETLAYQFGNTTAQMALSLDGTTEATDIFIDALAGYNVSIDESARLNNLAQQAADGSSVAFEMLRNAMYQLTGNTEQARIATLGMISAVNELSSTPLSIDVQVNASTVGQAAIANTSVLGSSSVFDSDWFTYSKVQDSYDKGTAYVPQTGIYELHQGERVMTVAENLAYTNGGSQQQQPIIINLTTQTVLDGRVIDERTDEHIVARNLAGVDPLQRAL